ncbi:hypothetical protein KI688_002892 [Linnemannia hyalina]|uniref:Uncharacterized protein n=1 Tax=Linnemannia hyalina TaxID=64524 RepID=A0A9P7XRH3_9FUNG|nr:hypothetical protein KI688_002892 [Linnemannia hyalina]
MEHHRDTLEEVHMVGAGGMTRVQILSFLTESIKLQIFDAMCMLEMESLNPEILTRQRIGDAIHTTADMDAVASTIPWACTGLKILKLLYAVIERAHQDNDEEEEQEES